MATENRLIDANALETAIQGTVSQVAMDAPYDPEWFTRLAARQFEILKIIDHQPTVDAVEVVRCKDCKYAENMLPIENGCGHLMGDCTVRKEDEIVVMVWGNDFCSYGERKDND